MENLGILEFLYEAALLKSQGYKQRVLEYYPQYLCFVTPNNHPSSHL